ncbi:hypothetical protein SNEBB_010907 [Seison nebaliae]|nr:hypothetical protein SNEBB_010907 [Seison nebaliae]
MHEKRKNVTSSEEGSLKRKSITIQQYQKNNRKKRKDEEKSQKNGEKKSTVSSSSSSSSKDKDKRKIPNPNGNRRRRGLSSCLMTEEKLKAMKILRTEGSLYNHQLLKDKRHVHWNDDVSVIEISPTNFCPPPKKENRTHLEMIKEYDVYELSPDYLEWMKENFEKSKKDAEMSNDQVSSSLDIVEYEEKGEEGNRSFVQIVFEKIFEKDESFLDEWFSGKKDEKDKKKTKVKIDYSEEIIRINKMIKDWKKAMEKRKNKKKQMRKLKKIHKKQEKMSCEDVDMEMNDK